MTTSQHAFTAEHYAPRAQAYVDSVTHSSGDDLDQMEALLRGAGSAACWTWDAAAATSATARRPMSARSSPAT